MSFLKKALLVNSSALICFVIRLAQTIVLSRLLGPAGIGQYALITSALMLATQISALGFPMAFLYHSQHDPQRSRAYQINCIWAGSILGMVGGLVIATLVWRCDGYFGQVPWFGCVAVGLYTVFMIQGGITRNSLLRTLQAKRLSIMTLSSALGPIALVLIFAACGRLSVGTALICFMGMHLVRMALGWYWIGPEVDFRIRPSGPVIRKLGTMGLRLGLVDVMVLLNSSINIMIIKWLITDFDSIGYFSRGLQVAMLVVTASQAVLPLLFSRWASLAEDQLKAHFEKVLRFVTTFSLVVILLILVTAKWVILALYGNEFLPAVVPMMILLPGTVLYLLAKVVIQFLGSRGLPEISSATLLAGALINALLSVWLIPVLGIRGAALASTSGNLALVVLLMVMVVRRFNVNPLHCVLVNGRDCRLMLKQMRKNG